MKITKDDLARMAELAAVDIRAQERQAVCDDLARILDYVQKLADLDTTGIAPFNPGPDRSPLRADEPGQSALDPTNFAPEFDGSFFLVPRLQAFSREEDS